jgi:hypothetical protein
MPEVTIEAELRTESGNGLPAVPVVLAASPELSTATGPRPLNPRVVPECAWSAYAGFGSCPIKSS